MDIEKVFKAVDDWYDGEYYQILGLESKPDEELESEGFEQSTIFDEVRGVQSGCADYGYYGLISFKIKEYLWLNTAFSG